MKDLNKRENWRARTLIFDLKPACCYDDVHRNVTILIEYGLDENHPALSMQGTILDMEHREPGAHRPFCEQAGQCIDSMLQRFPDLAQNERFMTLFNLWDRWHLNDMQPGTPEQMQFLRDHNEGKVPSYTLACDQLKEAGLYEVNLDGEPYLYGHKWLYEPLPDDVIALVETILDGTDPAWKEKTVVVESHEKDWD